MHIVSIIMHIVSLSLKFSTVHNKMGFGGSVLFIFRTTDCRTLKNRIQNTITQDSVPFTSKIMAT